MLHEAGKSVFMRLPGFYYVWMNEVKMAKNGKLLQKLLQKSVNQTIHSLLQREFPYHFLPHYFSFEHSGHKYQE